MYKYRCPDCGTELTFRKRATVRERCCPHCNRPITTPEIDARHKHNKDLAAFGEGISDVREADLEEWQLIQKQAAAAEASTREEVARARQAEERRRNEREERLKWIVGLSILGAAVLLLVVVVLALR